MSEIVGFIPKAKKPSKPATPSTSEVKKEEAKQ